MITFTVLGVPIPKGSTKAFFRPGMKYPVVTHDNSKTKPWQESVATAANEAIAGRPPLEDAVVIWVDCYLPRPKSAPKRVIRPLKKPDGDKLLRSIKDGCTRGGIYVDDNQVVLSVVQKNFAGGMFDPMCERGIPRAVVRVLPLAETDTRSAVELLLTVAHAAAAENRGALFAQRSA